MLKPVLWGFLLQSSQVILYLASLIKSNGQRRGTLEGDFEDGEMLELPRQQSETIRKNVPNASFFL